LKIKIFKFKIPFKIGVFCMAGVTREVIKNLKPGKYVLIDGEPCKVLSVTTSVAGKHGSAKARLEAIGVFDGRRRSVVKPADEEIEVPIIEKRNGQIISIIGEQAQVMDLETYEVFEVPIPEELKDKIEQGIEVIYWDIVGRKMLVQIRGG
jgi:translation initiation factor 5A